jgi:hypothetical protein
MNKDNDIDQLFKDGLSDPDIPFNELDWEKMERKLDIEEKKRIVPMWVYTASGIAAVLMISLYFYFSAPSSLDKKVIKVPLTKHVVKPGTNSAPLTGMDSLKMKPVGELGGGLAGNKITGTESLELARVNAVTLIIPVLPSGSVLNQGTILINPAISTPAMTIPAKTTITAYVKPQQPVQKETDSAILVRKANALAHSKDPFERIDAAEIARSVKNKMENSLKPQNDLILSAMAAPDMSFAKSSKPSKVSSNVGVLATYAFTPKISMTSGAIYSRKFYNSGGTSPQSSSYLPGSDWQVSADCNVLDIPLNVNYKIFNKNKLSVSLNTGLSSYFMLKEKYEFTTGQGDSQKVSNLEINNQNQHLFGIANVSVSFDRQISPAVSIGVQPFAKLPLTGIGYGDASLKSAGVSFSLNIGLFPAKKPGKYAVVRY